MSPERPVYEGKRRVWVSVETWCLLVCLLHVVAFLTFTAACCPVASKLSAPPAATASCLPSHSHSQTQSVTAPCCSSESLRDKWSWVLTMAIILWRGWRAVSLYSANLITDLLFACVSAQCNLKATPGPLGDAKTACQSTGTSPKWIKVGYSGLSWPWGDVHTGFCSRRNKLNTVFYYRVTVKCVMYVNPSKTGRRRARLWRDKMMALREKERGKGEVQRADKGRKLVQTGQWRRPVEGERDIEKMIERWHRHRQKQADRHSQQGELIERARTDRWKDKGTFTLQLKSFLILIFVTHHVKHRFYIFESMWCKEQNDIFFFQVWTHGQQKIRFWCMQLHSAAMTISKVYNSPEIADIMLLSMPAWLS